MRFMRFVVSVALIAFATAAYAQSDAQKSFDKLKTLAGNWEGVVGGTDSEVDGKAVHLTLRVTSMGNALMHDMHVDSRPDNPITMVYMDGDRLMLTHYCDAGNRPRMVAKTEADGKMVDFEFLDIAGSSQYGHMHGSMFTLGDANHHTEDWTFMEGNKPIHVHLALQRVQ